MFVHAVDRPEVSPWKMPERFRTEVVYFAVADDPKRPGEYVLDLNEAKTCLDELVVRVVSPLDAASKAEIELTEEQEAWLEWVVANQVARIRLD